MRRRDFISLLGGAAAFAPMAASAQQPGRIYRVAVLLPVRRPSPSMDAFIDEMRQAGFVQGRNLELNAPDGFNLSDEQIAELTERLVKTRPDAIVAGTAAGVRAAQQATQTIPIVATSEDMLTEGLVDSMARPSGNTTGISIMSPGLDGKRLDLLIEMAPKAKSIAALFDTKIAPQRHTQELQAAAQARSVSLQVFGAATPQDVGPAIDAAKAAGAEAINFLATPLFTVNSGIVYERLRALRLPSIHQWPDLADDGALAGYGPRFTEMFRQRGRLLIKVLRGLFWPPAILKCNFLGH